MTEATVVTSRDRFHAVAGDAASDARVPVEVRTAVADPYDAYRRARRNRDGEGVLPGLSKGIRVGRYHSLVVETVPDTLEVTARGAGEVMALRHPDRPVFGVQFHPESILTPGGKTVVRNFVRTVERHG